MTFSRLYPRLYSSALLFFLVVLTVLTLFSTPSTPTAAQGLVFVGAGDIAACSSMGDEATAALLDRIDGLIFTAGDNIYPNASERNIANCWEPSWGRHKARIRPVPGNHDYIAGDASQYFAYFGEAAGPAGLGYYSFNYGSWHIIMLNSVLPLNANSPQEQWLRADLAANPAACTLAVVHHPVFSSGQYGVTSRTRHAYRVMYEAGVEVMVSGDAHHYERFAPQDPTGQADPERGVRQFIVGTGGAHFTPIGFRRPNSEARIGQTNGVLKFTLFDGGYSWEFVPVDGQTSTDSGSYGCH
jgi:acid phosphatase type 7